MDPPADAGETVGTGALLTGTLQATAVTVWIDPGIIRGWLPSGVRFEDSPPDPYPLSVVWGAQLNVTAYPGGQRFPFPWRLSYAEIITAVPNLQLDPISGIDYDGPVTYLPRLYMNSWRAALLGRAFYGFSKAYARIEATESAFRAADRHGHALMSANIVDDSGTPSQGTTCSNLFEQPVVLKAAGRLLAARFETDLARKPAQPVSVDFELRPRLLSYLPAIRRQAPGIDREPGGGYRFSTDWSLRPLAATNTESTQN